MCMRCGDCCIDLLWVSAAEIEAMRYYAAKEGITQQNRTLEACPFLDREHECAIYEARPEICRVFDCSRNMTNEEIALLNEGGRKPQSIRAAVFNQMTLYR